MRPYHLLRGLTPSILLIGAGAFACAEGDGCCDAADAQTAAGCETAADVRAAAHQAPPTPEPDADAPAPAVDPEVSEHYTELVSEHIARATFAALDPVYQRMLRSSIEEHLGDEPSGNPIPAFCFVDGADDRVVTTFKEVFDRIDPDRYQLTGRWSGAVASGSAGAFGEPITLTWSFVPDGTDVPNGVGEGAGVSNLFAALDAIYGSTSAWQQVYFDMFDEWEALTGLNFVYEPNDDGAPLFNAPGQLGVRGDLRMAGKPIDGNSGILAYNFFPQIGDMVIDTADNFYNNTTNNSQALFNVLKHEHGHGMGLLHVCPIEQTKLMEPFISFNFTGAQHDDIRGAHRLYGDFFEPNDTIAEATDAGAPGQNNPVNFGDLPFGQSVAFGSRASINLPGDTDVYRFEVLQTGGIDALVVPLGLNYQDNPQQCSGSAGNCCSGVFIDSLRQGDLVLELLDSSGNVLVTADDNGVGNEERIDEFRFDNPGVYYLRVSIANNSNQVQLYTLDIELTPPPFLPPVISLPNGAPTELAPGQTEQLLVEIDPRDDTILAADLLFRNDGGAFAASPLTPAVGAGPNQFTADIPANLCDDNPEFFVRVEADTDGFSTLPEDGGLDPFNPIVGSTITALANSGETSIGFNVFNDADLTDGGWELGIPVNNGRGDPPADADGSGPAWLTDNDPSDENSDVDGGTTILNSPVIDITGLDDPTLSYARWYDNTVGAAPQADVFTVQVSDDAGSTWTDLEVVGPTINDVNPEVSGGWVFKTFTIADFVTPTSSFRVRFIASDLGSGSVVEAGVDAISVTGRECDFTPPPACDGDVNLDGATDVSDFFILGGNFGVTSGAVRADGDLNGDGAVDVSDFFILGGDFGCPNN
mgnify:CR=1 FL=1